MLESTVAIFEPRLRNPKVFMEPVEPGSKQLRFRIDGLLDMDPAPERVTFDTMLDLTSQAYVVKGNG
jgi:type VI secretion system protein ImpF